jgi:protein SCO1/2
VVGSAQQPARHAMTGMVLKVDQPRKSFVVSHDNVPGVMPAMAMPFDVRDVTELEGLAPGMLVSFTLVIGAQSAYVERVRIVRYQSTEQDPLTARRLRLLEEMAGRAPNALSVGQTVPDFTLTDQMRRRVSLSQFRGKVVAVNFIYTSCALPQFCYRVASQFSTVQRQLKERMGRDVVLLTVTFDPARDMPERLAEYAGQWKADPSVWRFLTGTTPEIKRVCGLFGVDVFADEGLVNHSLRTAIIGRQGQVVAKIEGNQFTAGQLGDLLETAAR